MNDYETIDISSYCNVTQSILGNFEKNVVIGETVLRGIPFLIGGNGPDCWISPDASVNISIGKTAKNLIIAHAMLETSLDHGGPVGKPVAKYTLHYVDGSEESRTIRERFEIAASPGFPPGAPGAPYLAVSDQKAKLMPRYKGYWSDAGLRQMEANKSSTEFYYLWAWKNLKPDVQIQSLEIVPIVPKFIIAAVTLGNLDEYPFHREGRRPVRIILKNAIDADKPFNLDVEVDRGDATYAFPLPAVDTEEFLNAPYFWGQDLNETSSPSYVEVSATPSATVTVKHDGNELGSVNWGEVTEKSSVETDRVKFELIDPGKNWVHVKVVDDDTGRQVPCRVHFRSYDGVPFQPHGYHNQVNSNNGTWHIDVGGDLRLGQMSWAYIDGRCQGWLPRGNVVVDVARGFEYEPIRSMVNIKPGQRELELRIKRWTDMNSQGWYSGDSHVHFLSPTGAHLEAQGEDLDVVNILQSQWGSLFTNTEDFTGSVSTSEGNESIVYVSQENRQHFMGHMILWGLKQPVMPWCSDGLGEAEIGGAMETTLAHWADEAHRQGGFVINPHFPNPNGEPAALVATNRLDGIEMIRQTEFNHTEYYRYLNGGYRLPLVGGTDKMSNDVPVGLYRTYVNIPKDEEFTYYNWCSNVTKGRTFLSGGPLIGISVEGQQIGDTVTISGPGVIEVEAWAESIFPINVLQIVVNGEVVAQADSRDGTRRLELKEKVKIDKHSWVAARCGGPNYMGEVYHIDAMSRGLMAHTSPIYVAVGGKWWMFSEDTARYMFTMIQGDINYIRYNSVQHTHGNITHHHGEEDHIAFLERPFHEALEVIQARARKHGVFL